MVSLVDVTESRRIHEILNRKQKNLEAIFDATPLGMLLVNDRMKVDTRQRRDPPDVREGIRRTSSTATPVRR